jgi:arabinan endo-1,5-alpha-L-arabinosidase
MVKESGRYYSFNTGNYIASKFSTNRLVWSDGPTVFSGATLPAWINTAVPNFGINFWAPDIIEIDGLYHLYYSCSTFGVNTSAIGLVTSPSLGSPVWTDQGPVIQSNGSVNYNAIDPSVLLASNGTLWMAFGSFWDGIKMIELDPATGKRIATNSPVYSLARRLPSTAIEAACLIERSNYFYLFVNWDTCCSGLNSTYQIRVGRSTTVTGPYLDRNNLNLYNGGGTLVLEGTGKFVGPGHAGILVEGETNWFTYHYYDATTPNGTARLAMGRLTWSADGWPQLTNDWCAFYPFEADAREHRGLFNGTLRNGATVTNEPSRSQVLNLNGSTHFATLPIAVANASTFAAWVKWNGGGAWQRIFDFGNNTNRYLFLTPSNGVTGRLRFGIKSASSSELTIDAPTALPVNSWCHVAVTLDGSRGLIYLNGKPVATNNTVPVRPWQVLSRTNYIGESQFGADPAFNGRIDSLRIYGRALGSDEILRLSEAHPSLAHRFSFSNGASDSIGTAHGRLDGAAQATNNALVLDGSPGTYVNLPGGLVTGCSAVTLEFWATFGTNSDWARVFDFGNSSGGSGQDFLFFSPRTDVGTHRLALATSGGVRDHDSPGTLDGQTTHVVCIADPTTGYTAIYTNGVIESETNGSLPSLGGVSAALAYLGRSLFSADPWLNATIDEFRIYHGRLTPDEIAIDHAAGADELAIPVQLSVSNDPAGLAFSWPAYAAGFDLESSASVGPDAVWNPVAEMPTLRDDAYRLTLLPAETTRFFRLHR